MPTTPGVRLALLLACALMPAVARVRPGPRAFTKQSPPSPGRPNRSPGGALREWEERKDWTHFTTRVLGDTAVTDSMKSLLASGISPNTQDKYGRTALHAAALLGQPELTRFLLSKGADVNARDRDGRTALMVSASAGGFDHISGPATVSPWGLIWTEPICDLGRPEERLGSVVRGLEDWHDMVAA